jgi:hypothetical protein
MRINRGRNPSTKGVNPRIKVASKPIGKSARCHQGFPQGLLGVDGTTPEVNDERFIPLLRVHRSSMAAYPAYWDA